VADLVDASLVTVTEASDGEPRIGMMEMVRAYASTNSPPPVSVKRPKTGTPGTIWR
jgi:hypothetical protein